MLEYSLMNIYWRFSAKREAAQTSLSLHLSKCHDVGNNVMAQILFNKPYFFQNGQKYTELNFDHSKLKRIQIALKRFWDCAII